MTVTASDIARSLDQFAKLSPPPPCWLAGDHADPGFNYCHGCAEKAVAAGKGETVDGGYAGQYLSADTCCHCENCGCLLDYELSKCGVEQEMDHFRETSLQTLTPEDAFHIARILDGIDEVGEGAARSEILELGQRALAAIPPNQGDTQPRP